MNQSNLMEFEKVVGKSMRGKKRPEHSELMRVKMLGIDRGNKFRELKKEQNKSINFKIKYLENKGYDLKNKTNEEIYKMYCDYISESRINIKYKIKKIIKFLKSDKYIEHDIYKDFRNIYENIIIDENNHEEIYKIMFSIISTIAIKNNEKMGCTKFFKSGMINTKFCVNSNTIKYRSSWELEAIEFLEKNKITYEYEPFYIKLDDGTHYLPDFLIEKTILLELKGFIRGKTGKIREEKKIKAAKQFCINNNMKFIYLTKKLENLKDIWD